LPLELLRPILTDHGFDDADVIICVGLKHSAVKLDDGSDVWHIKPCAVSHHAEPGMGLTPQDTGSLLIIAGDWLQRENGGTQ